MRTVSSLVLALALLVPTAASAESMPFTHDGFFLRLAGGLAYDNLSESVDGEDVDGSFHGIGGAFDIVAGYSVIPNLAIAAELWGTLIPNPTVSDGDGNSATADNVTMQLVALGVGATYHLPFGLYFGGTLGAGKAGLTINDDDFSGSVSGSTDWGFTVRATVGYEAWVGQEWGIGGALALTLGSFSEQEGGQDFSFFYTSINALFSATFN